MSEQPAADTANAAMRRYWNEVAGPRWVQRAEVQEARNIEVAELVLREAQARPGEQDGDSVRPVVASVATSGRASPSRSAIASDSEESFAK